MPQSVGYGEAEILRVGIRSGEACPPSDRPLLLNLSLRPSLGPGWVDTVEKGLVIIGEP